MKSNRMLLAGTLASNIVFTSILAAQVHQASPQSVQIASAVSHADSGLATDTAAGWHAREGAFFKREWGIDIVDVRSVASGEMLAFRYIVLDPEKAAILNDKRNTASLVDEKSGAALEVPQMEKVGALRTTVTPTAGKMYWIIFANTGRIVRDGSRVDVNIGDFKVQGLTVVSK